MKTSVMFILFVIALSTEASAQPIWQSCNGPYAGQVNALAVNRAGSIFAGTTYGGVFKSSNNGQTWNQINSGLTDTCVTCFAFSSNGHIFAGTWSQGIFRSTDDGQSWMAVNTGLTKLSPPGIRAIGVSATGMVFFAKSGGVFRSTDEGMSWTNVIKDILYTNMTALLLEPKTGYVFAASEYPIGGTLYRSVDNGGVWTEVASPSFGIYGMTVSPDAHIFFLTGQQSLRVYRSTDLGATWKGNLMGPEAVYVASLVATQRGGIFAGTGGYGVYQSADDGVTWSRVNNGLRHTWIYSLASNSDGFVFAGTDSGGVYRTVSPVTNVVTELTPTDYRLGQNYPNPFNPSTTIRYELPRAATVSLKIFNMLGQLVATLVDEHKAAGFYQVQWNASNVPSGVYFYRLQAGVYSATRKLLLTK